jgi:RNA polymerase sigma-70 factor (ECF subfamily)
MFSADFERILREQQAMVHGIAYHFFRNLRLADEVARHVFLQLYRNGCDIAELDGTLTWLRRTTVRRCIDLCHTAGLGPGIPVTPRPPNTSGDVAEFVSLLPALPRAVLVLRYGESLSMEEISAVLELPVAVVRKQLYRAATLLFERKRGLMCLVPNAVGRGQAPTGQMPASEN